MNDIYATGSTSASTGSGSTPSSTSTSSSGSSSRRASSAQADAAGNDDFFMFGEVFDANPAFMCSYTTRASCRRRSTSASRKAAAVRQGTPDRRRCATCSPATTTTPTPTPTPTRCRRSSATTTWAGSATSSAGGLARRRAARTATVLAHALMYLTRGQPVVYYGDEQGFIGDGGDKDARQDMFASRRSRSYNDDDLIGTDADQAATNFDTGHPMYQRIARAVAAAAATPGAGRRRPDPPRTRRRRPASSPSAGSTPTTRSSTSSWPTTRRPPQTAYVRDAISRATAFRGLWPARARSVADRRRGPDHRHRAAAVGAGLAGRPRRSTHRGDAPAMYVPHAGGPVAPSAAGPRSASRCRRTASTR